MRGLPPLPTDVLALTLYIRASEGFCSTTTHIWNPGSSNITVPEAQSFIADWFTNCAGDFTGVMPANTTLAACRLTSSGPAFLNYSEGLSPNAGAFGTCGALNSCMCLTWITSDARIGGRSHTLLPLAEEYIDTDRQSLTAFAYDAAGSAARGYVDHVAGLAAVDGALCVLAVVHRSLDERPLPNATWSPVLTGKASPRVATLRRRIRNQGRFSPF